MEKEITKHCPYCGEEVLAVAKKCKHCGEWLDVNKRQPEKKMVNCLTCGELIEEGTKQCPHCEENISNAKSVVKMAPVATGDESRSFFDYYLVEPFFHHYVKFRGRLNRKHYWMAMLIWFLVFVVLGSISIIHVFLNTKYSLYIASIMIVLMVLWYIVTLIPLYSTATRRLRDADSDPSSIAWCCLITASPFLMLWTCKKTEDEDSRIDGLEPDRSQVVKFKKSDKIAMTILTILFLIGIVVGSIDNEPSEVDDDTELLWDNSEETSGIMEEEVDDTQSSDEVIQNAIQDFLQGDENAVRFTEEARQDISESTWPEVYCSVEGMLNSPAAFNDLTVKCVSPGLYKYECICPDHGDKFEDFCTISASLTTDGTVQINHVTWDDANESLAALLDNASWSETDHGFSVPDIMTPSTEKLVDDVPGSVYQWTFEDVILACWPLLGEWAVTDYPTIDSYLTEEVKVKDITYRNSVGTVFSGYASDGRIWYMKKRILEGGDIVHAKALVLIYPKSQQSDVEQLINIVNDW